ncbi:hypothetical protein Tco_1547201 [Tanacetum coccineum]
MLAAQKAKAKRNKPMTQAQQRKYMCNYLKNMEGWKLTQLRAFSDADIVNMFNKAVNNINNFVDFRQELIKESSKTTGEEQSQQCLKRAGEELLQESSSKRQKVDTDKEKAELKQMMMIVPEEGI